MQPDQFWVMFYKMVFGPQSFLRKYLLMPLSMVRQRYAIDSSWTGATTSSTICFKSNKICHAGSCSVIWGPIRNGSNLSQLQFSWALPPSVFLHERFCGKTCLFVLSVHLYGKFWIELLISSKLIYFVDISNVRPLAISTAVLSHRVVGDSCQRPMHLC